MKSIVLLTLLCFSPALVFACGFTVRGISPQDYKQFEEAMREIDPKVEIEKETGLVHFTLKEVVTKDQVMATLAKRDLKDVLVVPAH